MSESTIGERIREIRKSFGLTQAGFSERLGITQSNMSGIECGKVHVTPTLLKLICHEFCLNEQWLVDGIPPVSFDTGDPRCWERQALQSLCEEMGVEFIISGARITGFRLRTPKGRRINITVEGVDVGGQEKAADIPKLGRSRRRAARAG